MSDDIVLSIHKSNELLFSFLRKHNEISLEVDVSNHMRKVLLLASASYFESEVTSLIRLYFEQGLQGMSDTKAAMSFLQKKALDRQYHTLFAWKENNCNAFLGLFGDDFKKNFIKCVKEDGALEDSVKAFMEIGRERNRLVHDNFGAFTIEKSFKEIINLHEKAKFFPLKLQDKLNECF